MKKELLVGYKNTELNYKTVSLCYRSHHTSTNRHSHKLLPHKEHMALFMKLDPDKWSFCQTTGSKVHCSAVCDDGIEFHSMSCLERVSGFHSIVVLLIVQYKCHKWYTGWCKMIKWYLILIVITYISKKIGVQIVILIP